MAVQIRTDNANVPFVLAGFAATETDAVIQQDAGRADPLVYGTVLAKVAANGKWTPFIDETAVDGTAIPQGIYVGQEITAAKLVAGDVSAASVLVGTNVIVARPQVVVENSKTLSTVITVGTTDLRTVEDRLAGRGIFVEDTVDITNYENS